MPSKRTGAQRGQQMVSVMTHTNEVCGGMGTSPGLGGAGKVGSLMRLHIYPALLEGLIGHLGCILKEPTPLSMFTSMLPPNFCSVLKAVLYG